MKVKVREKGYKVPEVEVGDLFMVEDEQGSETKVYRVMSGERSFFIVDISIGDAIVVGETVPEVVVGLLNRCKRVYYVPDHFDPSITFLEFKDYL